MGERVTSTGPSELARASRLKKALESGVAPAFVPSENKSPSNGARSGTPLRNSPLLDAFNRYPENAKTRLELLEQMSEASPDALTIADLEHRVLWANETFVELFGYEVSEILGQPLEHLVVPPDRLAESPTYARNQIP